jgi:hypothetical protein
MAGMKLLLVAGCAMLALTSCVGDNGTPAASAGSAVMVWNIGTARPGVTGAWAFVTDPPHAPQGFGTPTCNATTGVLTVPYITALTTIIGSAVMTDEDWSREGIIVGASVGADHADLYFTKLTSGGPVAQSCATIDHIGNVWIQVEGT